MVFLQFRDERRTKNIEKTTLCVMDAQKILEIVSTVFMKPIYKNNSYNFIIFQQTFIHQ